MARQEFLDNVANAADFLNPTALADDRRIDAAQLAGVINRADIWLTPKTVEGFGEHDFGDLPQERRRPLSTAVAQFLRIANSVPSNGPATTEQSREARTLLVNIVEVVSRLPDWRAR